MRTIKEFQEILKKDENLKAEYQKLTDNGNIDEIVRFVKSHGVDDKDIEALKNNELSNNELDGVSGGTTFF